MITGERRPLTALAGKKRFEELRSLRLVIALIHLWRMMALGVVKHPRANMNAP